MKIEIKERRNAPPSATGDQESLPPYSRPPPHHAKNKTARAGDPGAEENARSFYGLVRMTRLSCCCIQVSHSHKRHHEALGLGFVGAIEEARRQNVEWLEVLIHLVEIGAQVGKNGPRELIN